MIKFWGVEEVGNWLESLGLAEYKERFAKNDIQGEELLGLDRNDLKVCIHIRCQYIDAPLVLAVPGGVHLGILGESVPPGSPSPDPISDQKVSFLTSVFRPGL